MSDHFELVPCPTGHPIAQVCDYDRKMFYVVCVHAECFWTLGEGYDRDAMPDHAFSSKEDAIIAWNTRDAHSTLAAENAELRDAAQKALIIVELHAEMMLYPDNQAKYRDVAQALRAALGENK